MNKKYKKSADEIITEIFLKEAGNYSLLTESPPPKIDYDQNDPLTIEVEPRRHGDTHYFKVHDGKNYGTGEELCRISILEPDYEPWHSTPGKTELTLTNKEVKWLINKLAKQNKKNPQLTNLQYIIDYLNNKNTIKVDLDSIKPGDYINLMT